MFHFQIKLLRMIYVFTTKEEEGKETSRDERKKKKNSLSLSRPLDFSDFSFNFFTHSFISLCFPHL
jgi:hypothetical protein